MMGYSHAVSGATTIAVAAAIAPALVAPDPQTYVLSCLLGAGAAVMADADHPNAKAAKTFGPVVRIIGAISGGHRHGTHTIWATGIVGLACWVSGLWSATVSGTTIYPLSGVIVFAAMALGIAALLNMNRWITLSVAIVFGISAAIIAPNPLWLTIVITSGYAIHLLGDIITTKGVMILRPLPPTVRIPILGDAGSTREHVLTILLGLTWVVLTVVVVAPNF